MGNPYDDNLSLGQIQADLEKEQRRTQILRQEERALNAQARNINNAVMMRGRGVEGEGGSPSAFLAHLKKVLPDFLVPSNIGRLNEASWGHWYKIDFDFEDDPALVKGAIRQTQNFFVTANAGFLCMALSWNPRSMTTSGFLGPWNVTIGDRQSSRVFNAGPIPVQIFGRRGLPLVFPIPMYFSPSSYVDFVMDTYAANQATEGSGKHQFMAYGFRIRPEADPYDVLSLIFEGV